MSALMDLPAVAGCTATDCSYNHDGCHAPAVTIGGEGSDAQCTTFIPLEEISGGLQGTHGGVGACQRSECVHNEALTCTADAVHIGSRGDSADCLTYDPS